MKVYVSITTMVLPMPTDPIPQITSAGLDAFLKNAVEITLNSRVAGAWGQAVYA